MPTIREYARMRFMDEPTETELHAFINYIVTKTCNALYCNGEPIRCNAVEEFFSILTDNANPDGTHNDERTHASITAKAMDARNDLVSYPNLRNCIIDEISNTNRR